MKSVLTAMVLMVGSAPFAIAQDTYPSKPVTAMVGYLPGGAADLVMRKLAAIMTAKFPSGLIVENKPGVGGSLAVATVAKAKPDGYLFAFVPSSNIALSPQVNQLAYKSPDDILPVINLVNFSPVMLVPTDSPYKSVKELVQAARKSPETLSVGFPGVTTISHLNLLELQRTADIKFINVPQKGWGEGGPQLLGGHITAAIAQPIEAVPYLKAGTMRSLGSFSETRQMGLPDVPTMKEQGEAVTFGVRYLLILPKGTPAPVVKYLHDAAKTAMETPEFKKFTTDSALDIAYQDGATAKEAAWEDYRKYTSVLKQTGLVK